MHDEQQRQPAQQPDARTQQVLNRVRHIINKKNTQFILDHQHDSLAALSLYLRDCMEDIGHPPARVEVIGGDFLEYRFGSWVNALAYSGFPVSTGPAVSNFPLERTALFQAEYERQSALHAQAKKDRKKAAEAARREQKSEKKRAAKAAEVQT